MRDMYTMYRMSYLYSESPRIQLTVTDVDLGDGRHVTGFYTCKPESIIPLSVPMQSFKGSSNNFSIIDDKNSLERLIGVPVPEGANTVGIVHSGGEGQDYPHCAIYFARLTPDADLRVNNQQNYAPLVPKRPVA